MVLCGVFVSGVSADTTPVNYNTWVNGIQFNSSNLNISCESGWANYTPAGANPAKLELKDAEIVITPPSPIPGSPIYYYAGIESNELLDIVLIGKNKITYSGSFNNPLCGIRNSDINISGPGSLDINITNNLISSTGISSNLNISDNAAVKINTTCNSNNPSHNAYGINGQTTISDGNVIINANANNGAKASGISGQTTISGGIVNVSANANANNEAYGIEGQTEISGGIVNINAKTNNGAQAYGIRDCTIISGNSIVIAKGSNNAFYNIPKIGVNTVVFTSNRSTAEKYYLYKTATLGQNLYVPINCEFVIDGNKQIIAENGNDIFYYQINPHYGILNASVISNSGIKTYIVCSAPDKPTISSPDANTVYNYNQNINLEGYSTDQTLTQWKWTLVKKPESTELWTYIDNDNTFIIPSENITEAGEYTLKLSVKNPAGFSEEQTRDITITVKKEITPTNPTEVPINKILLELSNASDNPTITINNHESESIIGYNLFKEFDIIILGVSPTKGTIKFTLTNEQISRLTYGNSISEKISRIHLLHKEGGNWNRLEITSRQVAGGYEFTAKTNSFSPFAIVGEIDPSPTPTAAPIKPTSKPKDKTQKPTPSATPTVTVTETPTSTPSATPTETQTPVPTPTIPETPKPTVAPTDFPGNEKTRIESVSSAYSNQETRLPSDHESEIPEAVPVVADAIAVAAVVSASGRNFLIVGSIIKDAIANASNIGTAIMEAFANISDAFGDASDGVDIGAGGDSGGQSNEGQDEFGDESTENVEVSASILSSAGIGGTIEPSGTVDVELNSEVTFTVTPEDGYEIENVMVDGVDKGNESTFTLDVGKENHKVIATFRRM